MSHESGEARGLVRHLLPVRLNPSLPISRQPETKVGELCAELGVTRQTLYRHVDPKGALRPDGQKLFERKGGPQAR